MDGQSLIYSELQKIFEVTSNVKLMDLLLNNPYMKNLLHICLQLSIGIVCFSIAWEMGSLVFRGKGSYLEIFFRTALVILILANYPGFFMEVTKAFDGLGQELLQTEEVREVLQQTEKDATKKGEEEKGGFWNGVVDFIKGEISVLDILVLVSVYLSMAAVFIVLVIRNVALGVLTVFGPFFFVAYLSRATEKYFKGWIESYLNVALWPVVLGLILMIQGVVLKAFGSISTGISVFDKIILFSYNVVFIIMIIKAMTLIPEIVSGKGGAFSTAEGLFALAASKGGEFAAKKLGGTAGKMMGGVTKTVAEDAKAFGKQEMSNMSMGVRLGASRVGASMAKLGTHMFDRFKGF